MKLNEFEELIGLERFTYCVESKSPYWFKNYYAPLVIDVPLSEQINNNIVLTVLANQDTNEVVAVCTPTKHWDITDLKKQCKFIEVYLDVIYNNITATNNPKM